MGEMGIFISIFLVVLVVMYIVGNIILAIWKKNKSVNLLAEIEKICLIGRYNATQIIEGNHVNIICDVYYSIPEDILTIQIDGRKAKVTLYLNKESKNKLRKILEKALEWDVKAKETSLQMLESKRIETIITNVTIDFDAITLFKNVETSIGYRGDYKDKEGYASIMINNTQRFQLPNTDAILPVAIIFVDLSEVPNLINLLDENTIKNAVNKAKLEKENEQLEKSKIDDILN